jgi:hypothetical protein
MMKDFLRIGRWDIRISAIHKKNERRMNMRITEGLQN